MENEYYEESIAILGGKYYQTGHGTSIHFMRKGYSFLEKTSAVVDRISKRYDEEVQQSKTEGDTAISPFVKGLMAPATVDKKAIVPVAFGTVMGSLKRYQGSIKLGNSMAVRTEAIDAYCISLGDVLRMTYGPILSKQLTKLPRLSKSKCNDEDGQHTIE